VIIAVIAAMSLSQIPILTEIASCTPPAVAELLVIRAAANE